MDTENIFRKTKTNWKSVWKFMKYILVIIILPQIVVPILKHIGVDVFIGKINLLKLCFDPEFSLSSLLEIVALAFVGIEIRSTRKNIFIQNNLDTAKLLSSLIDDITYRLDDHQVMMLRNKADETVRQKANKIITLLDSNKPDEKKLIDCLSKYEKEPVFISKWIKDIRQYGKEVIANYKKEE